MSGLKVFYCLRKFETSDGKKYLKFEYLKLEDVAGKFSLPKELSFTGNLSKNWSKWKGEFGFYLTATESTSKPDAVKTSRLLTAIGEKGREVYYTFTFTDETEAMEYFTVLQKFDAYMSPKKNITYMRYRFFSCKQLEGQSIDDFATELKSRAQHCEFDTLRDSLIRHKLVVGVNSKKVQERLLREKDLDLNKAIQICRAAEEVKEQSQDISNGASSRASTQVDKISKKHHSQNKPGNINSCKYCVSAHSRGKCPAYNQICKGCGKKNHFTTDVRRPWTNYVNNGNKHLIVGADVRSEY